MIKMMIIMKMMMKEERRWHLGIVDPLPIFSQSLPNCLKFEFLVAEIFFGIFFLFDQKILVLPEQIRIGFVCRGFDNQLCFIPLLNVERFHF